jgi:hypothetical protein
MKGLAEHLQKSEVEYIATHGGGYPQTFKWDENIEAHIKRIGFRIKEHYDADGEWIRTTSLISLCLNDGFIVKDQKWK